MPTNAQIFLIGLCSLTIVICHPAQAQWTVPMPTAPGQTVPIPQPQFTCNLPGSQYVPQCQGRQDTGGRQETGERRENGVTYNAGPIGPIERATLPQNAETIIALVPDILVQAAASQNLPPMWMRVCRTNTASGGQNMFVSADGETVRLNYPQCTNVAFRRKVTIGTTSNDQATAEYQMLGRH